MNTVPFVVLLIGIMLLLERLVVLGLCRSPKGQEWIQRHILLHPNSLSIMRLPMGIITAWIALSGHWVAATLYFSFWMITDLSDGTIARACNLGSETGKWLDPLSDKFMAFPILLLAALSHHMNAGLQLGWVIFYILVDSLGQLSRLFVKKRAANMFGKAKTALITILLALIAINQIEDCSWITQTFLNYLFYACLLLAILSAYSKIIPDHWYANTFTLANFLCGVCAIYEAWKGHPYLCLLMVFIGQFFDLFDGRLARKYGSTKGGPMFDDIADATSFGLGIGTMVFVCLDKLEALIPRWAALIIAIFYVICLLYRLYRFLKPTKELPPGIFQGLPSPAGAMFAGTAVLASLECSSMPWTGFIASAMVILAALLMISNIRYAHFGQVIWPAMPKFIRLLIFLTTIILCVIAFAHKFLRPFFVWYVFGYTLSYLLYGIHAVNHLPTPIKNSPKPEDTHL